MRTLGPLVLVALVGAGCSEPLALQVKGVDWHGFVTERPDVAFRTDVCEGHDLRPDYSTLTEASLIRFLQEQRLDVQVQHQAVEAESPDLNYLFVSIPGVDTPVSLRVATLPSADEAGKALGEAI